MLSSLKRKLVHVLWDFENVQGTERDNRQFLDNLHEGLRKRAVNDHLESRTSIFFQYMDSNTIEFFQTYGETVQTGPSMSSSQRLSRKLDIIVKDYDKSQLIVVLVTGDRCVVRQVQRMIEQGYQIYIVSDFETVSLELKRMKWLEIWSFFVIAHGDLRKITNQSLVQHPVLGYKSPFMLVSPVPKRLTTIIQSTDSLIKPSWSSIITTSPEAFSWVPDA